MSGEENATPQEGVFGVNRAKAIADIAKDRSNDKDEPESIEETIENLEEREELFNQQQAELAGEEDPDNEDPDSEEDDIEEAEPAAQEHKSHGEAPVYLKDGEWFTKEKIDGVEREVPFNKVLANYQKNSAADQRLAQANERLRQAEEREARLREAEAAEQQRIQQQPSSEDVGKLKELSRQYHEALLDGEDDKADELLIQIQQSGRQPATLPLDESALTEKITRNLSEKAKEEQRLKEISEAQEFFKTEYSDIAEDPDLYDFADRITARLSQQDPDLSPKELVRQAGDKVREVTGQPRKSGRVGRKSHLKSGPSAASARSTGKPQPKPKTRQDTLNDLRAARGQATY